MLSAFRPRTLLELKQRDKSRIESVLAYDDKLLVGLSTGTLRVYRLNIEKANNGSSPQPGSEAEDSRSTSKGKHERTSSTATSAIDLMREYEKFSKYKVEQLALVAGAGAFLALSNAAVHLHDLKTCALRETLNGSKGATSLDGIRFQREPTETDLSGGSVTRAAVAVKRKVIIWEWRAGELMSEPKEFTLISGVKSLTWISERKIVVGLVSNYTILDIDTGGLSDIVGPGSIGGAPGQDGGRFGGAGVAGMGYLGMTAPTPLATKIGENEVMLAKDINTHFVDLDGNSLGRRQIPWSNAPSAIGYSSPFLLTLPTAKGALEVRNPKTLTFLQHVSLPSVNRLATIGVEADWSSENGDVLAFGERIVWRLQPADFGSQVHELVKQDKLDEAISLLEQVSDSRLHDRITQMRDVKILKAQALFDQHKFRDSIDLFTDVSAPPQRVIDLFPAFIAGPRFAPVDAKVDEDGSASPKKSGHNRKPSSINSKSSIHKDTKSRHTDDPEGHTSEGISKRKPLEGKALKTAVEELRGFLVSTRTKMKKLVNPDGTLNSDALENLSPTEIGTLLGKSFFDPATEQERLLEIAKLVDTTLFRAYMFVSPSFAGPLFRIDNFCDPDVVNEKLLEADRYNDLIDYFNGKKLHRQALELLKRFGNVDVPDEKAPQLAGPEKTVGYLQTLPPENLDLIFEYAGWPLQKSPELAMEIFLADTENAETLPRQRVVDFLEDIDLSLAVKYLEHIIQELDDKTPAFHQALADTYVRQLKKKDFKDDAEKKLWSQKTLEFLSDSQNYQAYKILGMLDRDDPNLFEARAIVLNSMGQYKQALEIYVFNLKDPTKAEEYCNKVYIQEASARSDFSSNRSSRAPSGPDQEDAPPSIYQTLLSLYLSPPPPQKPQWPPALDVLARHGARIPASATLNLIPESLKVKDLESYFQGRIRAANTVVNESRIVAGLRNSLAFREDSRLRLGDGIPGGNGGRNRRVVIGEERVCGICFKRFGGSAVKVLPDNSVIHYGCSTR